MGAETVKSETNSDHSGNIFRYKKTHLGMTFINAEKLTLFKETFVALSAKIERTPEETAWLPWGAQRINELEKEK